MGGTGEELRGETDTVESPPEAQMANGGCARGRPVLRGGPAPVERQLERLGGHWRRQEAWLLVDPHYLLGPGYIDI